MGLTICTAKDDKGYVTSKIIQFAVLISCVAATMSIYQISKGVINADLEFNDIIEVAYDLGVKNIGGGTVGVVIAYPLIKLLGMFGAAITTVGIVAVLCVFTFGLHPSEFFLDIMDIANEKREQREDEMLARREERIARRRNREKNMHNQNESMENKENTSNMTFDDDEITINLNNGQPENLKEEKAKGKFNFFKSKNKEEKVDNSDVIEARKVRKIRRK